MSTDAYRKGMMATHEIREAANNPYDEEDERHEEWQSGFDYQDRIDRDYIQFPNK